ncbi:MAG: GreA/GreB family elongation factor, partial [Terrimicrobiaceae bacterium]
TTARLAAQTLLALQRRAIQQKKYPMNEELQQAVDAGKLTIQAAEALSRLEPGACCLHKSWGFGRVAEWSLLTGQIVVDFQTKKGHLMQAQYAAETLQPIPADHILARKISDPAAVKRQALEDPASLVREILRDYGGKAALDQIAAALGPEIFDSASFKKWWDPAKKKLKVDGHFQFPARKNEPIVLLDAPSAPAKGLFERFRGARHLKDQVAALDQITKALDDLAHEVEELQALAVQIEDAAHKGRRLQSAQAIELLLARDEILARHQALKPGKDAPGVPDILRGEQSRLPDLFASLPASKQRRSIEQFSEAFGDRWVEVILRLMQNVPARLVVEIARLLEKEGKIDELRAALTRWISERSASSEVLGWLCKERGGPLPELFGADLFGAVLSALERDQLAEKRAARLHDLLLEDRSLVGDLLESAEPDRMRDAMRRLLLTPVFDDLNKRSLLARIVKLYPEMQGMISGDAGEREQILTVSWASLEKRKQEFEDLVNRQIPQNTRDIATARSYGDLRENFEFKSAKEQQRVLMRRRAEAARDLSRARGTNFENPDVSQVSIGTVVTLLDSKGDEETYAILGAWDSAPDLGIVSYKAVIGQALLGKSPGESVELPTETGSRIVKIVRIEPFTDLPGLHQKVHPLSEPAPA